MTNRPNILKRYSNRKNKQNLKKEIVTDRRGKEPVSI